MYKFPHPVYSRHLWWPWSNEQSDARQFFLAMWAIKSLESCHSQIKLHAFASGWVVICNPAMSNLPECIFHDFDTSGQHGWKWMHTAKNPDVWYFYSTFIFFHPSTPVSYITQSKFHPAQLFLIKTNKKNIYPVLNWPSENKTGLSISMDTCSIKEMGQISVTCFLFADNRWKLETLCC